MKTNRLLSLDVLRGFDMLFIMGGCSLALALCAAFGAPDGALARQFRHVPWEGLAFKDMIFPLFLFIAGASFPFSAAKRLAQGATRAALVGHVLRRGAVLAVLGLCYNGLLAFDFAHLRVFGALQLIGFAWTVAALLAIGFERRARLVLALALLLGPSALFWLVGAPDFPDAAPFTPEGNLGCWVDRTLWGGHILQPRFDPEGTAGLLASPATALLGVLAGDVLRSSLSGARKAAALFLSGALLVVAGLALSPVVPVVKALWSASFVLVTGGCSAMLLGAFYFALDVKGWRRGAMFFRVIGMNALTIYLAQRGVDFGKVSDFLLGGAVRLLPPDGRPVGMALAYLATCWLLLYFLYRKGIFLKV